MHFWTCAYMCVHVFGVVYVLVCVSMCVCICVYVHVYVWIYVCEHVCICTCVHIYIYACIYICSHVCVCVQACTCALMWKPEVSFWYCSSEAVHFFFEPLGILLALPPTTGITSAGHHPSFLCECVRIGPRAWVKCYIHTAPLRLPCLWSHSSLCATVLCSFHPHPKQYPILTAALCLTAAQLGCRNKRLYVCEEDVGLCVTDTFVYFYLLLKGSC